MEISRAGILRIIMRGFRSVHMWTRLGADFFPSKKTIIGFVVNGTFNHFTRKTDNVARVLDAMDQPVSSFQTHTAGNNDMRTT
jgi:hypothetical protein